MKDVAYYNVFRRTCHAFRRMRNYYLAIAGLLFVCLMVPSQAMAQSVSSIRSFNGGVAPLFNLPGPCNLYLDNQGSQGFLCIPGNNFESYTFRNPATGQAWSGGMMTLGPQLSIGLIQGANQAGTSNLVLPGPPRQPPPLLPIESTLLDDIP